MISLNKLNLYSYYNQMRVEFFMGAHMLLSTNRKSYRLDSVYYSDWQDYNDCTDIALAYIQYDANLYNGYSRGYLCNNYGVFDYTYDNKKEFLRYSKIFKV